MFLLRVPAGGAPSCNPIMPLEVRFLETRGGWRVKRALREPTAWRWETRLAHGVSVLAHSAAEAWRQYERMQGLPGQPAT